MKPNFTLASILTVSVPILIVMVGGSILTILSVIYRHRIARAYAWMRRNWHSHRTALPFWFLKVLRITIGIVGFSLIVIGLILMPLPGPGTIIVIAGAALMDLEFGWIVPTLEWLLNHLPESWVPDRLRKGLKTIKESSESRST